MFLKKMERHMRAVTGPLSSDPRKLKTVATPGVKKDNEPLEDRHLLDAEGITEYRGLVALLNYISQDRPDTAFASKESSKNMAAPAAEDIAQLKRAARYFLAYPRCAMVYKWQAPPTSFDVYTDSDWAGDSRTRKTTSGGNVMHGRHLPVSYTHLTLPTKRIV